MGRHLIKRTAAWLAVSLSAAGPILAQTQPNAIRPFKVSDFFVPAGSGFVTDRIEPAAAGPTPVLIHIQEAHANPDAQRQIVRILEDLIERHGLRLILVEGGHGPVGLADLRRIAGPEQRREVADRYLERGVLTGEEYLDLVSDHPLTLWGVEETALYEQNVEALLKAETVRNRVLPLVAAIRAALGSVAAEVPPAVRAVDEADAEFAAKRAGVADHAKTLARLAQEQRASLEPFPAVVSFLDIRQREASVDGPAVTADQKALLGRLGQLLSPVEFDALIAQARTASASPAARLAFYRRLEETASRHDLAWRSYPHLARHATLLSDAAAINPQRLADQLKALAAAVRAHAADSPEHGDAAAVLQELDLVQKLAERRLNPAEYETLIARKLTTRWPAWRALLTRAGASGAAAQVDELSGLMPPLERFYTLARQRDGALLDNALAKFQESGEPVAVLITGGFHGPVLAQRLRQRGLGAVIITPNVQQPTNERLYHAVLRYKSGQGSLSDVTAAAQQTTQEE